MLTICYHHVLKYILLIRTLSNTRITDHDISFSKILVEDFVSDFSTLYGSKNMTFNLHCHLHLPSQVARNGPLHLINCFPFEDYFF